jgi:phosphate transport system substrate-binding protein
MSNPPARDQEYWGPGQYGIDTDKPLANYWGGLYGFDSTEARNAPPFPVTIGLSHSGVGLRSLLEDRVDFGNASAPVDAELRAASDEKIDQFVNHVVGVDAQPIAVSKEIYDSGVTTLTLAELKDIYKGRVGNWSELGGPDRAIEVIGRPSSSGTTTAFKLNVFDDPTAPLPGVDSRKGQNQVVRRTLINSDGAIAYLALAFVEPPDTNPPIVPLSLQIDGTTYTYGENLATQEYPLSRDLHMYTWQDTSKKEAAFLRMILSEFGQRRLVSLQNYVMLPEDRRAEERAKLPDPVA